jgi:hypothetical protein
MDKLSSPQQRISEMVVQIKEAMEDIVEQVVVENRKEQVQAGEDGLAENPYEEIPFDSMVGEDIDIQLTNVQHNAFREGAIAQKALCDKEWREKIEYYKYSYLGGGHYKIIITEEQWEELLSEMGGK